MAVAGRKPGPDPTGKRVRPVSVALRSEDVLALRLLAFEQHSQATGAALGAAGDDAASFKAPPGPSVSAAIRYLIDQERERRIKYWREMTRRGEHPAMPDVKGKAADSLSDEEVLEGDIVFGRRMRSAEPAAMETFLKSFGPPMVPPKKTGKPKGTGKRR